MSSKSLILVSGGSKGLGYCIVTRLLEEGYRVATFSRRPSHQIEEVAKARPADCYSLSGDLGDRDSLNQLVSVVESDIGQIEGLVNNAGMALDGVLATAPEAQIEHLVNVNLLGTVFLTRQVIRRMLVRRRGRVVNISSIIGLRGYSGLAIYSVTKAGIDGMTRALARELGSRNITVNSVAPGYLETEMTHGLSADQRAQIVRRTPLGRLGKPEDVAGAVSFLLSQDASFITGQTLTIDGGLSC